jgi:hypothetical protein
MSATTKKSDPKRQAHQEAIDAYNRAVAALNNAERLVSHLQFEVDRTLAVCRSFMSPKGES